MIAHPIGSRLGLALGGGGVRGLAHIGVLKAWEAEGFPLNCLAGSSMGGLIAAAYAASMRAADLEAEALRLKSLIQIARLLRTSSTRRGAPEGGRLRAYLCTLLGQDASFDSLPISLALTAVDLPTGEEVLLTEGSLIEATLATIAVPGLFPEVRLGSYELVDGGVLNNVPADVARDMGAGTVIAIDVNPEFPRPPAPSGHPEEIWPSFIPHALRDIYRAELIMASAITRTRLSAARPDLVLRPALPPEISIFWGFHLADQAIAAGEDCVHQSALQIRQVLERAGL